MSSDFLDPLLNLEEDYYQDGFRLGIEDGSRAGRIEGRTFGLEKGFEKFFEIGKLHGKSIIWESRMPSTHSSSSQLANEAEIVGDTVQKMPGETAQQPLNDAGSVLPETSEAAQNGNHKYVKQLPDNERLRKHIRTLFALTELDSLSTENNEEAVSDFDDRYKRALAKAKVVENIVGEKASEDAPGGTKARAGVKVLREATAERNMEDFGVQRTARTG